MFYAEDPRVYVDRVAEAYRFRKYIEALVRYHLYIDCTPMDGIDHIDTASLTRISVLASSAPPLNRNTELVITKCSLVNISLVNWVQLFIFILLNFDPTLEANKWCWSNYQIKHLLYSIICGWQAWRLSDCLGEGGQHGVPPVNESTSLWYDCWGKSGDICLRHASSKGRRELTLLRWDLVGICFGGYMSLLSKVNYQYRKTE